MSTLSSLIKINCNTYILETINLAGKQIELTDDKDRVISGLCVSVRLTDVLSSPEGIFRAGHFNISVNDDGTNHVYKSPLFAFRDCPVDEEKGAK